jgi:DNA-directed RNA polymerase specialized sigma24 family protein
MSKELQELNSKIDILIKLISAGVTADRTQAEAIDLLSKTGLQPKEIAEMVGTTANAVSIAIHRSKKKTKKKTKKRSA